MLRAFALFVGFSAIAGCERRGPDATPEPSSAAIPVASVAAAPKPSAAPPPRLPSPGTRFALRDVTPGVAAGFVAVALRSHTIAYTHGRKRVDLELRGKTVGELFSEIAEATSLGTVERAGYQVLAGDGALERLKGVTGKISGGGVNVDFTLLDAEADDVFRLLATIGRLDADGKADGQLSIVARDAPTKRMLGVLCGLTECKLSGAKLVLPREGELGPPPERKRETAECALGVAVARCEPLASLRLAGVGPLPEKSAQVLIATREGFEMAKLGEYVAEERLKIAAIDAKGVTFDGGQRLAWGARP